MTYEPTRKPVNKKPVTRKTFNDVYDCVNMRVGYNSLAFKDGIIYIDKNYYRSFVTEIRDLIKKFGV